MDIDSLVVYVNAHYEEDTEAALVINGNVFLQGDGYHHKIAERIEGYVQALRDFGLYSGGIVREYITRDHPLYNVLDFYDEEEEGY